MLSVFWFHSSCEVVVCLKTCFLSSAPALTGPSHPPTTATTPRNTKAWWTRCSTVTRYSTRSPQTHTEVTPPVSRTNESWWTSWKVRLPMASYYNCHVNDGNHHSLIGIATFNNRWGSLSDSRSQHLAERMRGTHTAWVGAQRTWTMLLYPPAPFTLGTYCQTGGSYTHILNTYCMCAQESEYSCSDWSVLTVYEYVLTINPVLSRSWWLSCCFKYLITFNYSIFNWLFILN